MLLLCRTLMILWLGNLCIVLSHKLNTITLTFKGDDFQMTDATELAKLVQTQKVMITQLMEIVANVTASVGTNYIRWGRTTCPSSAELLYDGFAAASHYSHKGGGANYLCLHNEPEWPNGVSGGIQSKGYIYGVEYQESSLYDLDNHDVPCAVCIVHSRGQHVMIPGRKTCDDGWTKEYSGSIMADSYTNHRSTYICVDENPEADIAGQVQQGGGWLYSTEAGCGSLPCPPYVQGNEITCVVCTQ